MARKISRNLLIEPGLDRLKRDMPNMRISAIVAELERALREFRELPENGKITTVEFYTQEEERQRVQADEVADDSPPTLRLVT